MKSTLYSNLFMVFFTLYFLMYLGEGDKEEICYDYVGCFKTDPEFYHPVFRPFNLLPKDPSVINTSFWLYTKDNADSPQMLSYSDREGISKSHFRGDKRVKIVCHGYTDTSTRKWVKVMIKSILEKDDVNVIAVDWTKGAARDYLQVCANARLVGRQIAILLKLFQDSFNFDIKNAHIIGHSIGAHVAGYAGEYLKNELGRISGLDPARPSFEYFAPTVRLDSSDAKFVDVIHTTGTNFYYLGVGLLQPIGHVDIYIDGGDIMKSCETGNFLETILSQGPLGIYDTIACNHRVAHDIFIQSIRQKCPFTAYACNDLESYKTGQCSVCKIPGRDCIPMGYYADQYNHEGDVNMKFYISISDEPDKTCLYHWLVVIKTTPEPQPDTSANLYVNIKADGNYYHKVKLGDKSYKFYSNNVYRFLLEVNRKIGKIEEIELWLETQSGWRNNNNLNDCKDSSKDRFKFKEMTFIPIDIIDNRERESSSVKFCNNVLVCGIPPNVSTTLTPTSKC